MKHWKVIVAGVLGASLLVVFAVYRSVTGTFADAYAVWSVARIVNDYMDAHEGSWPKGWEDLRSTYEASHGPNPEHMADLEARVEVDWTADPKVLKATPEPVGDQLPFRVIWLKDGRKHYIAEPNGLVWLHLQEMGKKPATTESSREISPQMGTDTHR